MYPSPADTARMDTSGSTSPRAITNTNRDHQRASTGLYPDLSLSASMLCNEEGDARIKTRPARPPPPRTNSAPAKRSNAISGYLSDLTKPNCEEIVPLYPHEVRWFYKAPGKYWRPLQGCDSLLLEQTYLSLNGGGMASAENGGFSVGCSDGVCEGEVVVMGGLYEVDVERRIMEPIYWKAKEECKVLRGCWFEVSGDKWWPFQEEDYARIEEEHLKMDWRRMAEREAAVRQLAGSSTSDSSKSGGEGAGGVKDGSAPLDSSVVVIHKLSLEKYDIQWLSNGEIYQMKKEITTQIWNIVGERLGKGSQFGATKLARGYKEPASGEDQPASVGHLVFVVHGIGQNLDMASIEKSSSEFSEVVEKVAKKNFPECWNNKRVEFIPVDWRTGLTLDSGMVNMVTLQGLKRVRDLLNSSANDILYYLSPVYGPELLSGLRLSLQKQYNKFIHRHPNFLDNGGTVSVIGHSLGSVLMFDLLREKSSHMCSSVCSSINSYDRSQYYSVGDEIVEAVSSSSHYHDDGVGGMSSKEADMHEELRRLKERVSVLERQLASKECSVLSFCVDHFFAFGSPLGLFIAMKADKNLIIKEHRSSSSMIPTSVCKRLHNLHHPSDPIAYRLEPLISPLYSQVKPVKVDYASKKISKDSVSHAAGPMTDEDLKEVHQQQQQPGKSWWSGLASMKQSIVTIASSKLPIGVGSIEAIDGPAVTRTPMPEKMIESDVKFHPDDRLKERLDFMLRESMVGNSYLNALTAHLSYWNSSDVAQYLLLQLYNYKST